MVIRQWGAIMNPEQEEKYLETVRNVVLAELARVKGYRGSFFTRRLVGRNIEYQVLSCWNSMEAIRQLVGAKAEKAFVPKEIAATVLDYDRAVKHYEVVIEHELGRLLSNSETNTVKGK